MNGEAWRFEAFVQGVGGRIKESLLVTIRIFRNLVRTDKIQFDLILFDPDFLNTFEFSLGSRYLQILPSLLSMPSLIRHAADRDSQKHHTSLKECRIA